MPKRFGLIVTLALLLSAILGGCGGSGPKDVANQFFKAITSGKWETAEGLLSADTASPLAKPDKDEERIVNALMNKITYKLGEAQVEGDEATVDLEMSVPDMEEVSAKLMEEVMPLAFSEDMTEEELDQLVEDKFVEILNDKDLARITYKGTVTLVKESGGWKILSIDGLDQDVNFFE